MLQGVVGLTGCRGCRLSVPVTISQATAQLATARLIFSPEAIPATVGHGGMGLPGPDSDCGLSCCVQPQDGPQTPKPKPLDPYTPTPWPGNPPDLASNMRVVSQLKTTAGPCEAHPQGAVDSDSPLCIQVRHGTGQTQWRMTCRTLMRLRCEASARTPASTCQQNQTLLPATSFDRRGCAKDVRLCGRRLQRQWQMDCSDFGLKLSASVQYDCVISIVASSEQGIHTQPDLFGAPVRQQATQSKTVL